MKRHHEIAGHVRNMQGWQRDFHDSRDIHLTIDDGKAQATSGSLETVFMPPVRDQLNIGSCTANAGCEAAGFTNNAETSKGDPLFSRLDLYAITRTLEGTPLSEDSGCQVRDVFKAMAQYGVCLEEEWAYVPSRFSQMPPANAMDDGRAHKAITYHRLASIAEIKTCIGQGFPFIGGFVCFESLMSAQCAATGNVPVPKPTEQQIGGHCIYFYGFDDNADDGAGGKGMLLFQNSWGTGWGLTGRGRLPYAYLRPMVTSGLPLASDFWTLRKIAA